MGWAKTDPKIKLNRRTENLGQKSRSKISVKKISVKNLGRDRDRDFTTETFQLDRNYASRPDINRSRPRLGHLGRARPNLGRDLDHLGPRRGLLRSFAPLARFLASLARFLALSRARTLAPMRPLRGLILKYVVLAPKCAKSPTKPQIACVDIYSCKVELNKHKWHKLRPKHECGKGKSN